MKDNRSNLDEKEILDKHKKFYGVNNVEYPTRPN